jgi:hypothetical protein
LRAQFLAIEEILHQELPLNPLVPAPFDANAMAPDSAPLFPLNSAARSIFIAAGEYRVRPYLNPRQ